jgi:hypothetical protein
MVLYLLAMRPDVATVIDQPEAVAYIDESGKPRSHTFDFLIILKDGRRCFVAVKTAAKASRSGIRHTLDLIAGQLSAEVADSVHLITDAHFTRVDRFNAAQAFECARFPIAEHDDVIDRITADMLGAVRISDLVEASGLEGLAFRAVVRLITRGVLAPAGTGRITPETYVVRNRMGSRS